MKLNKPLFCAILEYKWEEKNKEGCIAFLTSLGVPDSVAVKTVGANWVLPSKFGIAMYRSLLLSPYMNLETLVYQAKGKIEINYFL